VAATLLACLPEPDADPDELRWQLAEIEGVSTTIPAALPRPLAKMIRRWAQSSPGEDLAASLTALEDAIASGRRYDGG
jgi:hypothetical protein